MHEYETNILRQQIARLENTLSKRTIICFVWLMLLSNLLFWLFIAHASLKHNTDALKSNLCQCKLENREEQSVQKLKNNLK